MPSERLLDYDPVSGMKEWFSYDESTDTTAIRYEQDITEVIDACKAAQNEDFDKRADLWHAAHVPVGILMEWVAKYGVRAWDKNHAPAVRRLLNDPDYRWLRVKHFIM